MIEPMLACPVDLGEVDRRCRGYVTEPKLDGVRCIVTKHGDTVTMTSRSAKQDFAPKVPHLVEALQKIPYDFIVDGELGYLNLRDDGMFDGMLLDFNKTMRVLGSGVDVALEKQADDYGDNKIALVVFDMLQDTAHGILTATPEHVRRYLLEKFIDHCQSRYDIDTWITVVDRHELHIEEALEYYAAYVEAGGEGIMLKNPNATYAPGKRPRNRWFKLKDNVTEDARITGYLDGEGKYTGQVGAIYFVLEDGTTGKCSGMDDATRLDISQHREEYKDRWFEVKYFGRVGADKSGLRHPQFVRWRMDK